MRMPGRKRWLNGRPGIRLSPTAWIPTNTGPTTAGLFRPERGRTNMADPARGDVWLADLGTGAGHEQHGRRPVLVLSVDDFNNGPAGLVTVLPLTSKVAKSRNIPAHVPIHPPDGGLKTPSV